MSYRFVDIRNFNLDTIDGRVALGERLAEEVLRQGGICVEYAGRCVYQNDRGQRCNAGLLLPPTYIVVDNDAGGPKVLKEAGIRLSPEEEEVVQSLQFAHDGEGDLDVPEGRAWSYIFWGTDPDHVEWKVANGQTLTDHERYILREACRNGEVWALDAGGGDL